MARRVSVVIDKISHINDVTFLVYRSTTPGVDTADEHILDVFDPMATKQLYVETTEELQRDPLTPYIFYAHRHFETVPFPTIKLGGEVIDQNAIRLYPETKMVELIGLDIGIGDSRRVYMTYEYQATPIRDDYPMQGGVQYYGPPATGLRPPKNVQFIHHHDLQRLQVEWTPDLEPITYYYGIQAKDSDGNLSPYADEQKIDVTPDTSELYFFLQRSKDGQTWEDVQRTTLYEWYDVLHPLGPPAMLRNLSVERIEARKSKITFDNPWYHWMDYDRSIYQYRIRSEDFNGEVSPWFVIAAPPVIHLQPKELLIRRKVDNGGPATEAGTDAIDFMKLTIDNVDVTQPTIELIDDALSEGYVYAWTFFYKDELNMISPVVYLTADHT